MTASRLVVAGRSFIALGLLSAFMTACAGTAPDEQTREPDEASSGFDAATPTGGVIAPGSAAPVEPSENMENVSFEEGESAGPAEHVRGAPEREDIPSFKLFGTNGEGPG